MDLVRGTEVIEDKLYPRKVQKGSVVLATRLVDHERHGNHTALMLTLSHKLSSWYLRVHRVSMTVSRWAL